MTDQQKFWLKVVLFVTLPIWLLPAALGLLAFAVCSCFWTGISELVEPTQDSEWDGPL